MKDRVAVKPDDVDSGSRVVSEELPDSRGVKASELVFDRCDRTDAAENRPQPFAELSRVGDGQRWAAITRSCPSVSTIATSIPVERVPLITKAHHILGERSGPLGALW